MAYADDVFIMGRRLKNFEEVFTSLVENTNKMGLEINEKYINLAVVSRKADNENEYKNLAHMILKFPRIVCFHLLSCKSNLSLNFNTHCLLQVQPPAKLRNYTLSTLCMYVCLMSMTLN